MNTPSESEDTIWPPAPIGPAVGQNVLLPLTWRDHLATAPLEVVLFGVFAVVVSLAQLTLTFVGPKLWREAVYPYVGGNNSMYLFGLIFAFRIVFTANRDPTVRQGIIWPLLITAASGAYAFLTRPTVNFHNPYLTFSPWQPVWTVLVPLAWVAVLLCPLFHRRHTASVLGRKTSAGKGGVRNETRSA